MKQLILILLLVVTSKVNSQTIDSSDMFVYEVNSQSIKAMRTCFIENESIEESLPYYYVRMVTLYYSNYINTKPDSIFFLTDTGYVKYPIVGEVIYDNFSNKVTYQFKSFIDGDVYYTGSFTTSNDNDISVIIPSKEHLISWESKVNR